MGNPPLTLYLRFLMVSLEAIPIPKAPQSETLVTPNTARPELGHAEPTAQTHSSDGYFGEITFKMGRGWVAQ